MASTSPTRPAARNSPRRSSALPAFIWLAAALAGVSCGSPAPANGGPVPRQVVRPEGGTAGTPNGRLKIQIPPNALKSELAITIQEVDAPAAGAIGPVFEIGPTGTPFAMP